MRELLPDLENWLKTGERVALATVLSTWGSAPRPAGSFMAISESGQIAGSVSGGCVEGAVIQAAHQVLKNGTPQRLHFGVADETAWEVGLACGGEIEVFVQELEKAVADFALQQIQADHSLTIGTLVEAEGGNLGAQVILSGSAESAFSGSLTKDLADRLQEAVSARLDAKAPKLAKVESNPELELFLNPIPPEPSLVLIGGGHIAIALGEIAKAVHYHTIVVDPRRVFATDQRFPHIDQLIQEWPEKAFDQLSLGSSTAVATLSHDPKIDDPALSAALGSPAFYVGALGSQKSHAKRLKRLEALGVSPQELERIKGPIGLDIGAVTPEEIALAIMAEVIAAYRNP